MRLHQLLYLLHRQRAAKLRAVVLDNERNVVYLPLGQLRLSIRRLICAANGAFYLFAVKALLRAVSFDYFAF